MSRLIYLASDVPLPERPWPKNWEDDEFGLIPIRAADDMATEKRYAVALEWHYYTEKRAKDLIGCIREALLYTDEVELWHIWMGVGVNPLIRSRTISIEDLTVEDIRRLENSNVLEEFYELPIQYRLVITASPKN